jgi:hypothetical protein
MNMKTTLTVGPGKLVPVPEKFLNLQKPGEVTDQEERENIWQEQRDHIEIELQRFRRNYPHVPFDDTTEAGKKNLTAVAEWLQKYKVAGDLQNLVECLNDIWDQIIFSPAAADRPDLGRDASGKVLADRLDAAQFMWLLSPHPAAFKADVTEPGMSAADYKKQHPEGWEEFRQREREADIAYIAKQVDQFKALRPQYIPTDQNRQMLLDAVAEAHLQIDANTLADVFDRLVKAGKIKANQDVEIKLLGIRRTDFAGGVTVEPSKLKQEALQWVKSHSSREIEARLITDKDFRDVLNS